MLFLRELRFVGIGAPGCRFDDLRLDLWDPRTDRPIDTVLWLRNGGGKTAMLSLFFAIPLPQAREFLGYKAREDVRGRHRELRDYVLPGDTAHAVARWVSAEGRHFVTGYCLEYDQRTRAGEERRRPNAEYYLFEEGSLSFAGLPFVDETGRRLPQRQFVKAIEEAQKRDGRQRVVRPTSHLHWEKALAQIGIDAELFRYQVRMNSREGGADKFLDFGSNDEFISFLLRIAMPDAEVEDVGRLIDEHRDQLRRQPEFDLDLEFCREAVVRLEPVAAARDALATARSEHAGAVEAVRWLHGGLSVALHEAAARAGRAAAELAEHEEARRRARAAESMARTRAADLEVRKADLAVVEAEVASRAAATELQRATELNRAWRGAGALVLLAGRTAEHTALGAQLDAAAAPLQRDLAAAAAALARALQAQRDVIGHDLQATARHADEVRASIVAARRRLEEIAGERAEAAVSGRVIEDGMRRLDEALDRLCADSVLRTGEPAAAGLARLDAAAAAFQEEAGALAERLGELAGARTAARQTAREAGVRLAGAYRERTSAEVELDAVERRRHGLVNDPRLARLVEYPIDDLWTHHDDLAQRLVERVRRAEHELLTLALRGADDRRALEALDAHGLLPPTVEMEHCLRLLAEAGIPVASGWRALADMVDADRAAQLLRQQPEIAAGIVVLDAERLDEARQLLKATDVRVTTLVTVETSETLLDRPGPDPALWTVPVAAALYDRRRGAAEVSVRRERLDEMATQESEHRTVADTARAALAELGSFIAEHPAERVAVMRDRLAEATAAAGAAQAAVESAHAQVEALDTAITEGQALAADLQSRLVDVERRRAQVRPVAQDEGRRGEWEAECDRLTRRLDGLACEEMELREWLQSGEQREHDLLDRASAGRAAAGELARELAAVSRDVGEPAESVEAATQGAADGLRGADLDGLRARHALARETLSRRIGESEASIRREAVGRDIQRLEAQLAGDGLALGTPLRRQAEELLRGPEGGTEAGRRSARERAEVAAQRAGAAHGAAQARLRQAQEERRAQAGEGRERKNPPADILAITDTATAQRLLTEANQEANEQSRLIRQLETAIRQVETARTGAEHAADQLGAHVGALARELEGVADLPDAAEVAGAAGAPLGWRAWYAEREHARRETETRIREVRRARDAVTGAERALGRRLEAVRLHAGAARYAELTREHRVRLQEADGDAFLRALDSYVDEYRRRIDALSSELAGIARIRAQVVAKLADVVKDAIRLLRRAERSSELPAGLGDWSGRRFLDIAFEIPKVDGDIEARLGSVVDDAIALRARFDAHALLVAGVRAANLRGSFDVTVLRPDPLLMATRVAAADLSKFSGGEKLTAATLLYCMFAQLRQGGTPGRPLCAGVLLLDNPIGVSNHVQFLDVQRRVAEIMQVQLVATTGVNDFDAVASFPKRIRLRQVPETTRRRKHVMLHSIDVEGTALESGMRRLASVAVARHADLEPEPAPPA